MNKREGFWETLRQGFDDRLAGAVAALALVAVLLAGAWYFGPRALDNPWGRSVPESGGAAETAEAPDPVGRDVLSGQEELSPPDTTVPSQSRPQDTTTDLAAPLTGAPQEEVGAEQALPVLAGAAAQDGQDPELLPAVDLSALLNSGFVLQRAYGYDYNPNSEDYRFHRGADVEAVEGQPVFAPAAGRVTQAAEDAYWGGIVVIQHEGWQTVLRCVTPRVSLGDQVTAGDFIASVSTAPAEAAQESHLHVEVETAGESMNPALYF